MTDVQSHTEIERTYDLLDALPNPIYVWRRMPDGGVYLAFANAAGHHETDGRVAAVLGCELRTMYQDTEPEVVATILQTLADGEPRRVEHEYQFHSTGRVRWFRTSYMRTTADEVLVENEDLTERRRYLGEIEAAERRVRRERTRFAELLERAPALICTFRGPQHIYEFANEECRRFLGRDDVIGRKVAEVMPELAEQTLVAHLDRVLATGEPFIAAAVPVQCRTGTSEQLEERHFNVTVLPIEEQDDTRSGIFVYAVDVTRLVNAARAQECLAEELRTSQERHELVLTATRELIYDWDIASDSVFYSDALYTAFRHRRGEIGAGYAWWVKQLHADDREAVTASLRAAVERGDAFWSHEYRFRRGDGRWAIVLDRGHVIRSPDGAPVRIIGSRADVTEPRQLEMQLRESQKMQAVGRLAGGVAHDFNNLLTAILGYADLALADASGSRSVREEIQEIRKAAQRAAQLTRQLLAFGRRQIRRPTRVDVDAVVRDTDRLLTQLLGEHIQLTVHAGARGAAVHMDPSELDQILVNLAVNARDAMAEGGAVTIETSRSHVAANDAQIEFVVISVSDTGAGIAAETMPHIFEPFFTTKGEAGNGLGLSTVYGIVEQNGGRIEVDSTVGAGTRFSVYLPIAADSLAARLTPVQPTSVIAQAATVLLVEDENVVRVLAHRILERAGYRVFEARHGADALLLWREHGGEIDAVVTDLVMPEMGGRALADALRATDPGLPIVFMSGYSDDEMTRRGFADPQVAFLPKPFSAASLVGAVREALRVGA